MVLFTIASKLLAAATAMIYSSADAAVIDLSLPYQPLKPPAQISGSGGGGGEVTAELHLDVADYIGPRYNTKIYVYNGLPVGPTIRVKPGDNLMITLHNDLTEPRGNTGVNITNLHTDGLHISGMDPGDNVFIEVPPSGVHHYKYTIGKDHMGGTFWYHPHFQGSSLGSTAIQTVTGARGMLIIEDTTDSGLPEDYLDMPEVEMILSEHPLEYLPFWSGMRGSLISNWTEGNGFTITNATTTAGGNLRFVNLQYIPVVQMEKNKWYRWRMVQATSYTSAYINPPAGCEFNLLAKDGIYLTDAPRMVTKIILSPGNRADVAVRCQNVGSKKVESYWWFNPNRHGFNASETSPTHLMQLQVIESATSFVPKPLSSLSNSTMQRPCYLADLRNAVVAADNTFGVNFTDSIIFQPNDFPILTGFVNGIQWHNELMYMKEVPVGTVQQVDFQTSGYHPYHQLVNPFQIYKISDVILMPEEEYNTANKLWYQVGDWHDSFMYPVSIGDQPVTTVRYAADSFTGHMVFHSNWLSGKDIGMMAQYNLIGEEGTVWPGARMIDPTCVLANEDEMSIPTSKPRSKSAKAKTSKMA